MALTIVRREYFFAVVLTLLISQLASAFDPDIIRLFSPSNATYVDGNFFTSTGKRAFMNNYTPSTFTVLKATVAEFPALNGQNVSYAILEYPAGSVNPPHTHPRTAELLYLFHETLEVGFVDTTNKLFTQTLQAGDMFVFPKGLVHYQFKWDPNDFSIALSAFGSASAGTVSLPATLLETGIDDGILAKSFKTNVATMQKLKAGLKA